MTQEMWIAVWAAVLGLVQVLAGAVAPYRKKGYWAWNASPRDTPFDIGRGARRLRRAFKNFMETFAFFAVIVVALAFAHRTSNLSLWGARLYLGARVAYIPCYIYGLTGLRTAVWLGSLAGILLCLFTLFK